MNKDFFSFQAGENCKTVQQWSHAWKYQPISKAFINANGKYGASQKPFILVNSLSDNLDHFLCYIQWMTMKQSNGSKSTIIKSDPFNITCSAWWLPLILRPTQSPLWQPELVVVPPERWSLFYELSQPHLPL